MLVAAVVAPAAIVLRYQESLQVAEVLLKYLLLLYQQLYIQ
jgi:hypothetical protein